MFARGESGAIDDDSASILGCAAAGCRRMGEGARWPPRTCKETASLAFTGRGAKIEGASFAGADGTVDLARAAGNGLTDILPREWRLSVLAC
ncbi:hypothetical protein [Burkholderia ambifaria]|uniref:hypothetical protein n=1 Tax=Burkholderia ambifaria TaxID=152480 RepID=UPI00158D048B|nr:hypothetical protein [Burkholderia ambifaria]